MRVFYEGDRGGGAGQEEPIPISRNQWELENAIHEVPDEVWDDDPQKGFNIALDSITGTPEKEE